MKGYVSVSDHERSDALMSTCRMPLENGDVQGDLEMEVVCELKRASFWTQQLIKSEGDAFELYVDANGSSALKFNGPGKILRKLVRMHVLSDKRFGELYRFEPYIDLIVRHIADAGLQYTYLSQMRAVLSGDAKLLLELFNGCVDKIRQEAKCKQFQSKLNSYQRSSNKNYKELTEYVDTLFERYSRLLVLRVDLGYRKEFSKTTQAEVKKDREHLFQNTRSNKLFGDMVGYIWKLEHGSDKGFHYHMMFFFDGSKVREDGTLAKLIGEYWKTTITKGRGLYYNCNADKSRYKSCGIGMVDHANNPMRDSLGKAVLYLTKIDLYMKLQTVGRSMGKMERPNPKGSRGRPRAISPPKESMA